MSREPIDRLTQANNIENGSSSSFSFKCHRVDDRVYSINSISFNHAYGTFSTAGGDCNYFFWDKDSRQKLKTFSPCRSPITASSFNAEGNIFVFASGDDWSRGYQATDTNVPAIWVQSVRPEDVRPKNPLPKKR